MAKVIRLTEQDLVRLVKRVIKENQSKSMISENMAQAQSMVDNAKEKLKQGQPADPGMMNKIKDCIKREGLSHLMILTTGAGAYALGLIAALIGSGVGAGLGLALAGAILIILEGIGINGQGVADEVNRLVKCMSSK